MRPHVVAWLAQYLSPGAARLLAPTWFTMVGVAGLATLLVLLRHARQDGRDRAAVATVAVAGYLAAVVGGTAIPALIDLVERSVHGEPGGLRLVGMTSFWGYLAATVAVIEACRRTALPLGWLADRATPMLGVSLVLIRTGCFLAGCDYGKISNAAWAMRFPRGSPAWRDHVAQGLVPAVRDRSLPVHPTQLYEALVGVVIAVGAVALTRWRRTVGTGEIFLASAAVYCLARLEIENLRGDRVRGFVLGLSSGQVFALVALAGVAAVLIAQQRRATTNR